MRHLCVLLGLVACSGDDDHRQTTMHARGLPSPTVLAEALALTVKIDRESIVGPDAEMLTGDLLVASKDWLKVSDHYRDYLARRPNGPRRSEARFRLASALEAAKGYASEYVELFRRI